jgi:pimeloyl-ACP methyl ester carboxylesterase/heat shock protein HslJ
MKKLILIITLFLLALTITPALAQAPDGEEYIVQRGDWLAKIAGKYFGDVQTFQVIVEATNAKAAEDSSFAVIRNPNLIVPGQKLWIPTEGMSMAGSGAERVTAAIELTTNPWLWVSFGDPLQQFDLDNPDAYTISFNSDGTVNVKADCNNATGTYTADDSGGLSIQLGPMTMAACLPDSRSDEFVQNLSFVRNFFFENGFLYLDMMADGGTFQLASASEAMPMAAPVEFGEAWEAVDCAAFDVVPEIAAQADCGTVTVPENRSGDSDRTLQLAVVRVRSTSDSPGTPVIKGTGGPGSNGLQAANNANFLQTHADILVDRDWIFFSQRGTKYAQPYLTCPAYDAVPFEAALNNVGDEERRTQQSEAMQACLDDFAAQGVDLSSYNTNENAADIDSIRQALGYDKIIYYGQSYGTLLGQFLLRNHPEILESAIIDGIAPATAVRWSDVTDFQAAFQRVFEACAADEACRTAYPDPEGALAEAYAALQANPQPLTVQVDVNDGQAGTVQLDGLLAMNGLFIQLYTSGGYSLVPTIAYQMRDGDISALSQVVPLTLNSRDNARVMHFAMACSDDPVESLDDLNLDGFADMYRDLTLDDVQQYITNCPLLNLTRLPDSSDELVTSDVPTLLLQGGLDPATPVAGGNSVQAGLSNSYNIIFPAGTHIQEHDPCGIAIMDAFMTDPLAEPDSSCVNSQLTFAVPRQVTVNSADDSLSMTVDLPAGFTPMAQPNQYQGQTVILTFYAIPAGTPDVQSLEEALNTIAATSRAPLDNTDIVDGDPVAGYATKTIQSGAEIQGTQLGTDIIAFENEAGIYVIQSIQIDPATLEKWRTTDLPAILETVTVSGQ